MTTHKHDSHVCFHLLDSITNMTAMFVFTYWTQWIKGVCDKWETFVLYCWLSFVTDPFSSFLNPTHQFSAAPAPQPPSNLNLS